MTTGPEQSSAATFETTQAACLRAMGMLASGRAWLVFLISLALLVQIGLFAAANWADVLQLRTPASPPIQTPAAQPNEESAGQPTLNTLQNLWPPARWESVMKIALPIAGFAGLAAAIVLILVTIVGIQINLIGQLPALSSMISAFYWSIITVALLFPWGSLVNEPLSQMNLRVPWVFFSYNEVLRSVAANTEGNNIQALVWLRFLAWPAASLLAAWVAGARFGKAYWQVIGLAEMQAQARTEPVREI